MKKIIEALSFTSASLAFLIFFFVVLPLIVCFLCIGISYLLNFIVPAVGIGFYFIGTAVILTANIFIFVHHIKPTTHGDDFSCEDCLASAVKDEIINKPQSNFRTRHPKGQIRRK